MFDGGFTSIEIIRTVTKCILIDNKRGYTTTINKKSNLPQETCKSISQQSTASRKGTKYLLRGGGERKPLREERKEKIMRSESALKENQTPPWDDFHEGREGKNCGLTMQSKETGTMSLRRGLV